MTRHTIKLPHGYRIEATTRLIDREARRVTVTAEVFLGSDRITERRLSLAGVKTNGDLISRRTEWLNQIAKEAIA